MRFAGNQSPAGGFIRSLHFLKLTFENPRYDQHAVRLDAGQNPVAFSDQQVCEQVGTDDVILLRVAMREFGEVGVSDAEFPFDVIGGGVGLGDPDALWIEVERVNRSVTELCGGNCENSGTGANIEKGRGRVAALRRPRAVKAIRSAR